MSLGVECCLWAQEPVLNVASEGGIGGDREGAREHACLRSGGQALSCWGLPVTESHRVPCALRALHEQPQPRQPGK